MLIRAGRPPAAGPRKAAPLIPIPKATQRRSRAGSSPIRSSPNGGAAAWAAFPRTAADRRRPLASRPARPEAPRARRHQQSSQLSRRAPSLLPAAPLPRVASALALVAPPKCMAALRVTLRWLLASRAASVRFYRVVAHRFVRPAALKEFGCLLWWVGVAALTNVTQGTARLSRLATEVNEGQNRVVRSRAVVYVSRPGARACTVECQRYARSSTSALARVAKHSEARTTVAQ